MARFVGRCLTLLNGLLFFELKMWLVLQAGVRAGDRLVSVNGRQETKLRSFS